MAQYLKMPLQTFIDTHTKHIAIEYNSKGVSLVIPYLALDPEEDTCQFLNGKLCGVHEAKPYHCAQSPIMAEFLLEEDGWSKFSSMCPGIGQGPTITRPEIDLALQQQAERDMAYERQLEDVNWDLSKLLNVTLPEPEVIPDLGFECEVEE